MAMVPDSECSSPSLTVLSWAHAMRGSAVMPDAALIRIREPLCCRKRRRLVSLINALLCVSEGKPGPWPPGMGSRLSQPNHDGNRPTAALSFLRAKLRPRRAIAPS